MTRFFKRDSTKANNLTLYPHKEREFWLWMVHGRYSSASHPTLDTTTPAATMPPMNVVVHELPTDHAGAGSATATGRVFCFADTAMDLSSAAAEKRDSLEARVIKTVEIVNAARLKIISSFGTT